MPTSASAPVPPHPLNAKSVTVALGGSATFVVEATGTGPLTYQWQLDGLDLPGATESHYSIGSAQAGNAGTYRVVVFNPAGPATSIPAVLRVVQPGMVGNGSYESDLVGWMTLGRVAIGSAPGYPTTDGAKLAVFNLGQTTPDGVLLQNCPTVVGQAYVLEFDVGATGPSQKEQRIQVTVQGAGTLANDTLTVFAPGMGAMRWERKTYGFAANSASITVRFRDLSPTGTDVDLVLDNVRLVARDTPVIVRQPGDATVGVGEPVSLAVVALGTPGQGALSYQWRRDGADVDGATANIYTIANAQATDSGTYTVAISNGAGSVTSESAVLAVGKPGALLNGGFEPDFHDWTGTGNQRISWIGSGIRPVDGLHAAVFNAGNSTPNGILLQTIATTPGQAYVLECAVGLIAFNQNEQRMEVKVIGNSTLVSQVVSVVGLGGGQTLWVQRRFSFVADGNAVTVQLRDVSLVTLALDLLLDRVRVYPAVSRTLAVTSSNPDSGVNITLTPADLNGNSSGSTPLIRSYPDFRVVNLTAAASAGDNVFQKWLKDGLDFTTAATATVTVDADYTLTAVYAPGTPVIITQPSSLAAQPDDSISMSVIAAGGTLLYQWRFNGNPIPGASESSYAIASVQPSDAGSYDVVVSNASGSVTSSAATLTVVEAGALVNGSFESDYAGWTKSGNCSIRAAAATDGFKTASFNAGQTTPNAVVSQGIATTPGVTYDLTFDQGVLAYNLNQQRLQVIVQGNALLISQVLAINGAGSGTVRWTARSFSFTADSNITTLTFRDVSTTSANIDMLLDDVRLAARGMLTITAQPQSLTVNVGGIANFHVTATGVAPLSYQWRFNETPISGAVGSTHSISDVQTTHAGNYDVLVSDFNSTTTSAVAVLTVVPPASPAITAQPQSLTVNVGGTADFNVTATGVAPLSYQWRFNGTPISGAVGSTYSISDVQTTHAGNYDVVVSDFNGATTSAVAVLTVLEGSDLSNGSFEFGFTGWTTSGNCSIRVGSATDGVQAVSFNSGQTTPNAELSQVIATTPGLRYKLTFDQGVLAYNLNQQRLQVTVQGNALLLSQTLAINGVGNGTVKWTARSLSFTADSTAVTLVFRDVSTTSNSIDMLLDNVRLTGEGGEPAITTQPQGVTVAAGGTANFSVVAIGLAPLSYQWRFNGAPISGAVGSTYSIGDVQTTHAGNYDVVVSNTAGSVTSSVAVLTVVEVSPFVNGSFEDDFAGWTVTGNANVTSGSTYQPRQGSKIAIFNWGQITPNGVISQSFPTTPGQAYDLLFDLGIRAFTRSQQRMRLTVRGNAIVLSQTVTLVGDVTGIIKWSAHTYSFVADGSAATLTFEDVSPTGLSIDMTLDHVRVNLQTSGASLTTVARGSAELRLSITPAGAGWRIMSEAPADGWYRLERSGDLTSWVPVGDNQSPRDGVLEFKDARGPADAGFYRVLPVHGDRTSKR